MKVLELKVKDREGMMMAQPERPAKPVVQHVYQVSLRRSYLLLDIRYVISFLTSNIFLS